MSGNVNALFAVEGLCLKATMTEVSLMPRNKTRISWGGGGWGGRGWEIGGGRRGWLGFLERNHGAS